MAAIDAVIVGAGSGTRLGHETPKAFVDLGGKPMLCHSLIKFRSHPSIGKIILVVPPDMTDSAGMIVSGYDDLKGNVVITAGGDERWKSVRNGVSLSSGDWVLIHDAARPFVTREVIDSLLDKRERFDCVITATPEVDTVRMIKDGERSGMTVDRSKLMRVGTPQLFRRETLLQAMETVTKENATAAAFTDEAALFECLGMEVGYAWGDPMNFKITTKADFEIATAIVEKL